MGPYQQLAGRAHGDPVKPRRIARGSRSDAGCPRGEVAPLLLVPGFPLLSGLLLMLGLLLVERASPLQAQRLPPRQATVTAGIGNAQGWVGFQGEYYLAGERLSVLQVGYQYTAGGGFTLMASAGVGYSLGVDDRFGGVHVRPMLGLGVGYTWR